MKYMIHYSASAERDIDKALDYIINSLKNPLSAKLLQQREISLVNNLVHFPYKHPVIDDLLLAPYKIRYVPINNYLLFSRRDWQRILQNYVQYDEYLSQNTGGYIHEEQDKFGKLFKKKQNNMPENQDINNYNFDEDKARQELSDEITKGLDDIPEGRTVATNEVHAILKKKFEKYKLE